ncbi:hypothetical protein [Amycolatopsis sp. NPDC052450]|uniref:hypothetical protein n=1 Tax=Amycolatopsis sp. NPDC052450 TaxID=3363937 RepID=UPI0037CA8A83
MAPIGGGVGTPVTHVPGPAGESDRVLRSRRRAAPGAGALWDGFFELSRDREPTFS